MAARRSPRNGHLRRRTSLAPSGRPALLAVQAGTLSKAPGRMAHRDAELLDPCAGARSSRPVGAHHDDVPCVRVPDVGDGLDAWDESGNGVVESLRGPDRRALAQVRVATDIAEV